MLSHAFGSMQVGARIVGNRAGPYGSVYGSTMAGPGAFSVVIEAQLPYGGSGIGHDYSQSVGYVYKALLVPKRFALAFGANVSLNELELRPAMQPAVSGYAVFLGAGASAHVQLAPRLAVIVGPSVTTPLGYTAGLPRFDTIAILSSELLLALGNWDLYGQFAVDDLAHGAYLFLAAGFVHRWAA